MDTIEQLEREIVERSTRLAALRKAATPTPVKDYAFTTLDGRVSLSGLFAGRDKLLVIHNMGQACRYCTLWADGFNAFLPHLEHACSVVLVSKDPPQTQRAFALSRGWRFRMASHGGGEYIKEQSADTEHDNAPGMVAYVLHEGKPARLNATGFGPGDAYCALWPMLGLLGMDEKDFTPQFAYWQRPQKLEDGGLKVLG
ncbi:MAG: DUF899 family protein [Phycisphaerales bacterium]